MLLISCTDKSYTLRNELLLLKQSIIFYMIDRFRIMNLNFVLLHFMIVIFSIQQTMITQPEGSLFRKIFDNEMQAGAEVAAKYGLPVILGDQDISATNQRMQQTFKQSIVDILTPWKGGWSSLYNDIKLASSLALPSGVDFLGPTDFLNPGLLATTPVSLLRYPLSFVVKAPKFGIPVVSLLILSVMSAGDSTIVGTTSIEQIQEVLTSVLIFFVETSIFARVFLVALLSERNDILAANILSECQRISEAKKIDGVASSQKVVVAILGMAHCNGILKLLSPSKVVSNT